MTIKLIIFFLFTTICFSQEVPVLYQDLKKSKSAEEIMREEREKYNKKPTIKNGYELVDFYTYRLYLARKDGKYGVYDLKADDIMIPAIYDKIKMVYDDNSIAVVLNGEMYLVNNKNEKISNSYKYIYQTLLPNTLIADTDDKSLLLDFQGNVKSRKYDEIKKSTTKDRACVKLNDLYGLINSDDSLVIPIIYQELNLNYNSKTLKAKINNKVGVIDKNHNIIIDFDYDDVIIDQYKYIVTSNNKKGIFDSLGRKLIDFKYDDIVPSRKEYIIKNNNKVGILDSVGNLFIDCKYDNIYPSEKEYIITINNKRGLLDSLGNQVVDCIYDKIEYPSKFLYKHLKTRVVTIDGKSGVMDSLYQIIIPIEYSEFGWFLDLKFDKRILAKKDGKCGVINYKNEIIIPFEYNNFYNSSYKKIMKFFKKNRYEKEKVVGWNFQEDSFVYFVRKNGKEYLINENNEILYEKN